MSRTGQIILLLLLVAFAGAGGWFVVRLMLDDFPPMPADQLPKPTGTNPAASSSGKLVVLVVFDQFRGDYLDRWSSAFTKDGFERLKREGVWFANAHIPYACTSTAPGHASIGTGASPSIHGIVENAWLERTPGTRGARLMYCVQPPREFALVPPLRAENPGRPDRGSELGFSPHNLMAATVSETFRTAGKGKVVSLSIKDRAAVLMGGKTSATNPPMVYCFDLRDGRFHSNAYYTDVAPKWVTEFNDNRRTFDQWIGKDWTVLRPDLNYDQLAGPDSAPGENYGYNQGQVFPHPMNKTATNGGPEYYRALEASPFGSEVLLGFTKAAIAGEDLGSRGVTDLLCVSFSSNDLVGHQWGPDSWEVLDTTLRADLVMKDLLAYLDTRLGKDRYTVVLTADHGICPLPESGKIPGAERRKPKAMLMELAAALDSTFGPAERPTQWFADFDATDEVWPWVYLNRTDLETRGLDFDRVSDYAAQWLGNREYTLTAFTRKQIEAGVLPELPPDQQPAAKDILGEVKLAYQPDRCGDIVVIPQKGVLIAKYDAGTSHGSPWPYDTHVPIVAYGAGIPALGKREERVSSLLAAPLVAKSLGISPPSTAREVVPVVLSSPK